MVTRYLMPKMYLSGLLYSKWDMSQRVKKVILALEDTNNTKSDPLCCVVEDSVINVWKSTSAPWVNKKDPCRSTRVYVQVNWFSFGSLFEIIYGSLKFILIQARWDHSSYINGALASISRLVMHDLNGRRKPQLVWSLQTVPLPSCLACSSQVLKPERLGQLATCVKSVLVCTLCTLKRHRARADGSCLIIKGVGGGCFLYYHSSLCLCWQL